MAKQKQSFKCTNCSYHTVKWLGCCPDCNEWNSFAEQKSVVSATGATFSPAAATELVSLSNITVTEQTRMVSGISEWDRVLGGGIMPGSFLILTGDPGIGKSTLMLQMSISFAQHYYVFYFSSEESLQQIKMRAQRLDCNNELFFFLIKLNSRLLLQQRKHKSQILLLLIQFKIVIPRSQTIPGSIGQLRESAFALMSLQKNIILPLLSAAI